MSSPDRRTLIADTAIATVATAGLRGLTHRAIDTAAELPAGSTSYYFRTRTALISACYARIAELDLDDFDSGQPVPSDAGRSVSREEAAAAIGALLHRWLTTGRERQLARYELSLEAARTPELGAALHQAGLAARARAAAALAALGAARPEEAAELLVAWTEGVLFDGLVGAMARTRPAPDRAELTAVARRMLDAALAGDSPGG
ncbi:MULTISPECIES: TetR/AcrR family transcriptional regulator [unclassified Streptomyces]|uniref:TetR/AcrR family transcriptional regulator n=1 Tax=unclassified Streptomyces TaxID=2593676 RepID=UPI002E321D26|nr:MULTISPECIES: TetR family transcriptional regulator [unclassified Streptomyces]WUC68212.1 TetR family transcriptional regulator [Streptomyces sp. NBC_00539]